MIQLVIFCGLMALVAGDATRVEFKLYNYTHNGQLANGEKCDIGTHCDPRVTGYVDTLEPDRAWPGPLQKDKWALIFEGLDIKDVARLNKIVSRDICDGPYQKANLRMQADEVDPSRVDAMEQFMCESGRDVQRNEASAQWSPVKSCDSHHSKRGNKMLYSWRAYTIPARQCGKAL